MSTQSLEREYPYRARYGEPDEPEGSESWKLLWRTIGRWAARAALVVGGLGLITLLIVAIPVYRAARQAWAIAQLQESGIHVGYWHEDPKYQDLLSPAWREKVGDEWWSEVREVSIYNSFFAERSESEWRNLCAACGRFEKLQSFEIEGENFTCAPLANWPSLEQLETLSIDSPRITDADLAIIGRMKRLKSLKLSGATIGDEGIGHLAQLPKLQRLSLERAKWTGAGSASRRGFPALESLEVSSSAEWADEGTIALGSMPKIKSVTFSGAPISDGALEQLLQNGQVEALHIFQGRLTDKCGSILARNGLFSHLGLGAMPLTDAVLEPLSGKQIKTLSLAETRMTDEAFRHLRNVDGLAILDLSDTKVTGIGARYLNPDKPIEHLSLSSAPIKPAGIQALAKVPCSSFDLSGTPLDDAGLLRLAESDRLMSLDVSDTMVTAEGIKAFYEARSKRRGQTIANDSLTLYWNYPEYLESLGVGSSFAY